MAAIKIKPATGSAQGSGYRRMAAEVNHGFGRKEELWFDVSEADAGGVDEDSGNAWLMAYLPLAFEWGKPLEISAPVDAGLLQNAEKIQRVWAGWHPAHKPVPIQAPVAQTRPGGERTGLFFTGGVDSFFSLLHFDEAARADPATGSRPIDDLICVWGFDIPLGNRAAWEQRQARLSAVAEHFGKRAVFVATNLRQTRLRRLDWGWRLCGAALGAAGLLLGKSHRTILISSSGGVRGSEPWGSHRLTDPLMSSGQTQFVYYGGEFDRFNKTRRIVQSDIALKHLHVCWQDGGDTNCGQCEKCYRAMLTFDLLGVRERAVTFPRDNYSLEHLKSLHFASLFARRLLAELREPAAERGRDDAVQAIDACLANNDAAKASSPPEKPPRGIRQWLRKWF